IDDVPVGQTPLSDPLLVDAGRHKVSAVKQGRVGAQKYVTLAGADQAKVELDLPEEPVQKAPVSEPAPPPAGPVAASTEPVTPPPPDKKRGVASGVWVGLVATGALAAGAIATGVETISQQKNLEDLKNTKGTSGQALDDASRKAKTWAITAD